MASEEMSQEDVRDILAGLPVPPRRPPKCTIASIALELPLPGANCSPNSRAHWSKRHKSLQLLRESAAVMGAYELNRLNAERPMWTAATVEATFHKPGKRSQLSDADNLIASLKAAFDGLQDAGIIANDRGLTHLPPRQLIGDAASERKVVLVITRVE